jgi:hypothetical protein
MQLAGDANACENSFPALAEQFRDRGSGNNQDRALQPQKGHLAN